MGCSESICLVFFLSGLGLGERFWYRHPQCSNGDLHAEVYLGGGRQFIEVGNADPGKLRYMRLKLNSKQNRGHAFKMGLGWISRSPVISDCAWTQVVHDVDRVLDSMN